MADTAMQALVSVRSRLKGTVTRLLGYAETITDDISTEAIEVRLGKLSETWSEFVCTQNELYTFQSSPGYIDPDLDFEAYEEKYLMAKCLFLAAIKSRSPPANGVDSGVEAINRLAEQQASFLQHLSSTPTSMRSIHSTIVRDSDLPKIIIPPFTGNYKDWPSFRDLFLGTIDKKIHLTSTQKFHYLKSFLRDEALALIAHIPISELNYKQVWQRLEARYDRPVQIVNTFIKHFMDLPSLNNADPAVLRKISDGAEEVVRGLDAIDRSERDCWLIYLMLLKVDKETRYAWAEFSVDNHNPTIVAFLKFLNMRCEALELSIGNNRLPQRKSLQTARTFIANSSETLKTSPKCVSCSEDHMLPQCAQFLAMDLNSRRQYVKHQGLCFNCLRKGHSSRKCRSSYRCKDCGNRHHTLVHSISSNLTAESTSDIRPHLNSLSKHNSSLQSHSSSQPPTTSALSANVLSRQHHSLAILPTAVVNVLDSRGQTQSCRLMLDSGSQISFISENCVNRLGLGRKAAKLSISGISSSDGGTTRGCCNLQILSRTSSNSINITAYILPKIMSSLPEKSFSTPSLNSFRSLTLADPSFDKPSVVDIILGADQFWNVLTNDKILDSSGKPIAHSSIFGWIVIGGNLSGLDSISSFSTTISIDNTLKSFWELEETMLHNKSAIKENDVVETHFRSTVQRCNDGKYCVLLPFISEEPHFENTFDGAFSRLKSVERRFDKDLALQNQYVKFMREYIALGHMREVSTTEIGELSGKLFYLPHHPVLGKKLRVVFDGSYRDSSGKSLNDELHIGPSIQRNLVAVCLRFRLYQFVFSADIIKMFRQIWVNERHRAYQRILWREKSSDPVKHYELCTVTYGTSSAPYLSVRVLQQLATDFATEFPQASSIVLNDFYVDDVLTGADSFEELMAKKRELVELLSLGGFQLDKWVSNSEALLQSEIKEGNIKPILDANNTTPKVLGMHWDPCSDRLMYKVKPCTSQKATKRQILSDVARIFDPLGLLAPVVVLFKIMFQSLWLLNLSWDDGSDG